MADLREWERLVRLIEDDDAVVAVVLDALGAGEDPWEALLDGLDEAGALAYLRSDDTGMELADALAQLPRVFAVQPDLDEVTDTDDLRQAMLAADRALSEDRLRLLRLIEVDVQSWPLVAVPSAACAQVRALAKGLGREVAEA